MLDISASPIAPQVIRPEQWDLAATAHVREASDALYAAVKAYQKHSASAFKHRAAAHGLLPVVELRRIKLRKALAALDVAQAAISVAEVAR